MRGKRKRRKFATSGTAAILSFVKDGGAKGCTSAEINKQWKHEGRSGTAYVQIGQLTKAKKLKKEHLKGQRGSRYTVAEQQATYDRQEIPNQHTPLRTPRPRISILLRSNAPITEGRSVVPTVWTVDAVGSSICVGTRSSSKPSIRMEYGPTATLVRSKPADPVVIAADAITVVLLSNSSALSILVALISPSPFRLGSRFTVSDCGDGEGGVGGEQPRGATKATINALTTIGGIVRLMRPVSLEGGSI
jgi:hypothetical protein